jgi:hypothetical protein
VIGLKVEEPLRLQKSQIRLHYAGLLADPSSPCLRTGRGSIPDTPLFRMRLCDRSALPLLVINGRRKRPLQAWDLATLDLAGTLTSNGTVLALEASEDLLFSSGASPLHDSTLTQAGDSRKYRDDMGRDPIRSALHRPRPAIEHWRHLLSGLPPRCSVPRLAGRQHLLCPCAALYCLTAEEVNNNQKGFGPIDPAPSALQLPPILRLTQSQRACR